MDKLDEIRKRINSLDAQMASLFEERMLQCRQVAQFKREHALSITDSAREAEVIAKNSSLIKDDSIREYYARFQKGLMDTSKAYQSRIMEGMRVAYCGVPGAFAHIAAKHMFPEAELVPFSNFEDTYRSCENNQTDCAVLPIENSFAGDVANVMDLMFAGSLYVNQVVEIAAVQNLLGCEGTTRESIREVVSHPQAISQCSAFIRKNGQRISQHRHGGKVRSRKEGSFHRGDSQSGIGRTLRAQAYRASYQLKFHQHYEVCRLFAQPLHR